MTIWNRVETGCMAFFAAVAIVTLSGTMVRAAIIGFEAESGTLGVQFDPAIADVNASGGFYITTETDNAALGTRPGSDDFTASYTFALAAGTYDVYIRGLQTGSNDDSFYYAKNFGDAVPSDDVWQTMNGGFGLTSSFGWSDVLTATLTSEGGIVQWKIGAREDGFLIDAFAFVTSGQSVTDAELDAAVAASTQPPAGTVVVIK